MTDAATVVLRNIGALVTCDPLRGESPGVVPDAVLVCSGDHIVYAGPATAADVPPLAGDGVEVDVHGSAVIPGFVDSHSHIAWLGDRAVEFDERARGVSYEEIARRGGGIRSTVRSTAAGSVADIEAAAAHRARRMLEHGTTTVEVKSGYGRELDAELRQLDAIAGLSRRRDLPASVATYLPLHAPPEGDRAAFITDVCERGILAAAPRAVFCDVFCEEGAYSVEECDRVLRAARAAGLMAKVHADQRTRSGGSRLAAQVEAASADHLEHAGDDDLRALAGAGVVGVLLPGAALVLGGPQPPGRRLLEAGATVAIATDCNPGTSYAESMPLMVSLAVATAGLTPAEALLAATAGGAAALRLHDRGVLRAGMRADAVVLATAEWRDVAYHLGANPVAAVFRAGELVEGIPGTTAWS